MRKRPISIITRCFLATLLCLSFLSLKGQDDYFILAEDVFFCGEPTNFSIFYSNGQILNTEWIIIPSDGSISGFHILAANEYYMEVIFYNAWGYWIITNSITPDSLFLSDTIYIEVDGYSEVEVLSCYEVNPVTECYQVCSTSPTIIQLYQGTGFELFGALDYNYIGQETIEVIWSDAGGILYLYEGCQSSVCFEVFPVAVSDFTTKPSSVSDTLTVCMNEEILFENTSFNGSEYLWNFGDGSQSNSYNATHSFNAEGFYTVTLNAESICECGTEKQFVIEVLPAPVPSLDCVNSVCPETRQRYTATTNGCTQFNWYVSANGTIVNGGGPGDDFIEVIWHEGPDGIIELSVGGCLSEYCSTSNSFRIPIITPNGTLTGDTEVCTGEIATYTAPYFPGTQYQWQVGPAGVIISGETSNSISVRWNDVNVVTSSFVEVQYENCFLECEGSDNIPVTITPEIHLLGDKQVCQNAMATINASAGFIFPVPVNVQWHIEDLNGLILSASGGSSATFTNTFAFVPGEYYWVATNSSAAYCNEIIRQKITVTSPPDQPLGIMGEDTICPGQAYGFTVVSAGNFSTQWIITDGTSVFSYTGGTCQHIFGNSPPYIVQATHADIQYPECVSDPVTMQLKTVAEIIIEGPDEVCFNSISKYSTSYISGADYKWEIVPADHGEIKRTDLNELEIFWTKEGSATIRLLTCNTSFEKQIIIHELPPFDLTGSLSVCINEITAIATSVPLLSHTWLDNNSYIISIGNSVSLSEGNYAVSVEDIFGCVNEKPFTINSYPLPSIHLTTASPTIFCNTIPPGVELVANTDGLGYTFEWFKDDTSIGIGGPVFTVMEFGTYFAVVSNEYGCKASSGKITFEDCCLPLDCIGTLPGCTDGCAYIPQDFNIVTIGVDCQSRQYIPLWPDVIPDKTRWSISSASDGTIAIVDQDILTYEYLLPGYYNIIMIGLVNGYPYTPAVCGHIQELNDTIRAVAGFTYEGSCKGEPIQFKDLTTFLPDENIVSWSWDFGDPGSGSDNSSSIQDPFHTFSAAGDYNVKLTVTMMSGCITSKLIQIHISGGPDLMPIYDNIYCQNEALTFYLPDEVFDIAWNFGDPVSGSQNTAVSDSAFHSYELPGFYIASISASDIANCRSRLDMIIDIRNNNLSGNIIIDPASTICSGDTAFLTSPPGGTNWLWSTSETSEQISVTESNQFNVLVIDPFHCTYSPPPVFIEVNPKPEIIMKAREILGPDLYGPWQDSLQLCYGAEFEIQVFSPGFNDYYWNHGVFDDLLIFTGEGGNLPAPGHHQYTVVAEDFITDCLSDAHSISIEIFDVVENAVISLVSGPGCGNNENILQVVNPVAGISYHWSDGQIGPSITTTQAGTYTVIAIDQNGCTSQSNPFTIKPSALIDQIPGGCYLKCDPLTVCLPPLNDVSFYNIFQNGSLIESGTTWPDDFIINADGSYVIEVTSPNGCTAVSEPLNITLYTGVGNITVLTYLDLDGDGVISASDILLQGIPVQIISNDGIHSGVTETGPGGQFVFEDYPSTGYTALIDRLLLSTEWEIVIDSVRATIATCGDSVIVSLLLKENCTVSGTDQFFELCPGEMLTIGDSTWSDTGVYETHLSSISGCDSVFQVYIELPDSLEIGAVVWVDVDKNGMLSAADTVIQGIPVIIDQFINQSPTVLITNGSGIINGWFEPGTYVISIDSLSLPPGLELLSGPGYVSDTVCGSAMFSFLLSPSCLDVITIHHEELCKGDSILIEGDWITEEGVYSFILSQPGSGCDTILDVYVTIYPEMTLSSVSDWNCIDLGTINLTLTGMGPFIFEWSDHVLGDSILTNLPASNYMVTVTDFHGCRLSDTFAIAEPAEPVFYIQDYHEIFNGDSILIQIEGDITFPGLIFNWFPVSALTCDTCSSALAFPSQNTTINIQITDENGCEYALYTDIVVLPLDTIINDAVYIPNVFTPDGNGINDRFMIFSRHPDTYLNELSIFDRWGTLLFNANEIDLVALAGWDGTFEGKEMNPQVYTYKAKYTLADGSIIIKYGDVTLLR